MRRAILEVRAWALLEVGATILAVLGAMIGYHLEARVPDSVLVEPATVPLDFG